MKYYLVKIRYKGQFSFAQEPVVVEAGSPEQALMIAMSQVPVEGYYVGEANQTQIDLYKKRNETP